jgi:hypothetical protein
MRAKYQSVDIDRDQMPSALKHGSGPHSRVKHKIKIPFFLNKF